MIIVSKITSFVGLNEWPGQFLYKTKWRARIAHSRNPTFKFATMSLLCILSLLLCRHDTAIVREFMSGHINLTPWLKGWIMNCLTASCKIKPWLNCVQNTMPFIILVRMVQPVINSYAAVNKSPSLLLQLSDCMLQNLQNLQITSFLIAVVWLHVALSTTQA